MTTGIEDEFEGADFGDKRLEHRLTKVASRLREAPTASIPQAMKSDGALEGTYRFLRHPEVSPSRIMAPHIAATRRRTAKSGGFVVAHDTTHFFFSTPRDGLGRGTSDREDGRVFYGHVALAASLDGKRTPLGVLGAATFVREGKAKKKRSRHTEKKPEPQRESSRWWNMVEHVEQQLGPNSGAIHVMDREADQYLLLSRMMEADCRFVIRISHDRRIKSEEKGRTLKHALEPLQGRFQQEVPLTAKAPKPMSARSGLPKQSRIATLTFKAAEVEMLLPATRVSTRYKMPKSIKVNVVHVVEEKPPDGYPPVDWKLQTTEPIDSADDIRKIVDAYRTRWVIEEFFKALKTGCAFEKRQLESAKTIFNALAVFLPIAWSLFHLRHHARNNAETSAETVLSKLQLMLLRAHRDIKLPAHANAKEACLAVAQLGGHLKRNGPPGWITLGRGFEELLTLEHGAQLFRMLEEM